MTKHEVNRAVRWKLLYFENIHQEAEKVVKAMKARRIPDIAITCEDALVMEREKNEEEAYE